MMNRRGINVVFDGRFDLFAFVVAGSCLDLAPVRSLPAMTTMPSHGAARPASSLVRRAATGWTDLGANEVIAATTSPPVSRVIEQLQPFGERIFLGYGEWDIGLDRCSLMAWNTESERYETVADDVPTDAFWVIRVVNDELWALVTDPSVGTDPDAVVFDGVNVRTLESSQVSPWHLFDIQAWTDALYLAGANRVGEESHGAVWQSTDNGASWKLVLDLPDNARITGLFILEGQLYAVGLQGKLWQTDDGVNWTPSPVDLLSWEMECVRPLVAAGQALYLGGWSVYNALNLYAFDGRKVTAIASDWSVYDIVRDDDSLLILTNDRSIKRTTDLVHWEIVATNAPQRARSLCVLDQTIYVGTADSRLWKWSG